MKVAELMKKIEQRQGNLSNEKYARNFDISGSTLFRWRKGERSPDLGAIRGMARYYKQVGDTEMLEALSQYALFGGDCALS